MSARRWAMSRGASAIQRSNHDEDFPILDFCLCACGKGRVSNHLTLSQVVFPDPDR